MINVSLQAQTRCSMQAEKALLLTCFTPRGPATYLLKVCDETGAQNNSASNLLKNDALSNDTRETEHQT